MGEDDENDTARDTVTILAEIREKLNKMDEISEKMGSMDERLMRVEGNGNVGDRSEQERDNEIPMAAIARVGRGEAASEQDEVSPGSLRKDISLMAEAASRIAQLQMDDYVEQDDGTGRTIRRVNGKKSGSVMMSSDVVEQAIDWPHLHVRRMVAGRSKSIAYADLKVEEFVAGFLRMIAAPKCKWDYRCMIDILCMIMVDAINFSWPNALGFYETLGIAVEKQELVWADKEAVRDQRLIYPRTATAEKKEVKEGAGQAPKNRPALSRCCAPFQNNACQQNRDHPPFMHACAYCFKTVAGVFRHPESSCGRKMSDEAKNGQRRE